MPNAEANDRPILVVSPLATFRSLLADQLTRAGCRLVVGAESLDEALRAARHWAPSSIVVDCTALSGRWLDALSDVRGAAPDTNIVVLGEEDDAGYETELKERDGCSYRSKLEPLPRLISALGPRE